MNHLEKLKAAARRASKEAREGGPKVSCAGSESVPAGVRSAPAHLLKDLICSHRFKGIPEEMQGTMHHLVGSVIGPVLIPHLLEEIGRLQEKGKALRESLGDCAGMPPAVVEAAAGWDSVAAHLPEGEEE